MRLRCGIAPRRDGRDCAFGGRGLLWPSAAFSLRGLDALTAWVWCAPPTAAQTVHGGARSVRPTLGPRYYSGFKLGQGLLLAFIGLWRARDDVFSYLSAFS